jgi:hypothetical protein
MSESTEDVRPVRLLCAGSDCSPRFGCACRALSLEFVGHRFFDGLDQGVELLLRERLGRCRRRLRKTAARQSQQEDKYYRCP